MSTLLVVLYGVCTQGALILHLGFLLGAVKLVQTSLLTDVENLPHFIIYWQNIHDSIKGACQKFMFISFQEDDGSAWFNLMFHGSFLGELQA